MPDITPCNISCADSRIPVIQPSVFDTRLSASASANGALLRASTNAFTSSTVNRSRSSFKPATCCRAASDTTRMGGKVRPEMMK